MNRDQGARITAGSPRTEPKRPGKPVSQGFVGVFGLNQGGVAPVARMALGKPAIPVALGGDWT